MSTEDEAGAKEASIDADNAEVLLEIDPSQGNGEWIFPDYPESHKEPEAALGEEKKFNFVNAPIAKPAEMPSVDHKLQMRCPTSILGGC